MVPLQLNTAEAFADPAMVKLPFTLKVNPFKSKPGDTKNGPAVLNVMLLHTLLAVNCAGTFGAHTGNTTLVLALGTWKQAQLFGSDH